MYDIDERLLFEDVKVESAGKCPLCGQEMTKHIIKEGARYHVHSYHLCRDEFGEFSKTTCSTKDCEHNHGYGKCVPRTAKHMEDLRALRKKWKDDGFTLPETRRIRKYPRLCKI